MKASETKLIRIIEGTNQYLVPHFQRPYTWERKHWDTLWGDVGSLVSESVGVSVSPEHFMGAIVTAPAHSVPEGVTKYLLIDGQQRLTTLLIFLAAIRFRAGQVSDEKLRARIHEMYLTNRYQDGSDQYKLLPTQGVSEDHSDRASFIAMVDGVQEVLPSSSLIREAYVYFVRQLKGVDSERLTALANAILNRVFLVSIVLEKDDNPYAIFESLNAKGQPLSQSDLVRNFFFMSIDARRHDEIYYKKWVPMEDAVGRGNMESYLRHFLIRDIAALVNESETYFTLKNYVEKIGYDGAEAVLNDLVRVSNHYVRLLEPERESNEQIRSRLYRLQRLRATVCYPFLLKIFEDRARLHISDNEVAAVLDVIENFIVRRYVCGTMRAELNELFAGLYRGASRFDNLVAGIKEILGSRRYPSDGEFTDGLMRRRLYGAGEAREKAKLILERIESSWGHKERVDFDSLSIEHVMPQTLNEWWRSHLGERWDEVHAIQLHNIGNLTLTGYNSELSNSDFWKKKEYFFQSNIALNKKFSDFSSWTSEDISARAKYLSDRALLVWPNFAPQASARKAVNVRGTTPKQLFFMGDVQDVKSWQDVLNLTLVGVSELGDATVGQLLVAFPRQISKSQDHMQRSRVMVPGVYYETALSAERIYNFCSQVVQSAGLSSDEWRVDFDE